MRCFQIEYTSCRRGEHAGFQIRAATPGAEAALGQDDMDEVIRLGLYRPPLADGPSPVAFRAARLLSGRQIVQYSRYLGQDDTGREGNFCTRSLVAVDPEAALPRWAMEYYEWPGWQDGQLWNEDNADQCAGNDFGNSGDMQFPVPLTALHLHSIPSGESFSYTELRLFVREHPNRADWLTVMLMALFRPACHRRLVVRDEKENNPYWLACLTRLLPRSVANSLNLSTCQPDAHGFDLVAVPPYCEAPAALLFEPGAAAPPRPENSPRTGQIYARKAVGLLLRAPEALPGFLRGIGGIIG